MASHREQALTALAAALATLPGATVQRNEDTAQPVPAGGLIILRDGEREAIEVTMWPVCHHWQHDAVVDVLVQGRSAAGRDAALDQLLLALGAAIAADPTLGGAVDWAQVSDLALEDLAVPAGAALKGAVVTVSLLYASFGVLE
jgi:hypothetical protein